MGKKTKTKKVPETVQATEAPVKVKERRAVYVFCALLMTILPLAVLCLLNMKVLLANGSSFVVYGEESYLNLVLSYFKDGSWAKIYEAAGLTAVEADLFGFGLIAGGELFGKIYGVAFYVIAIAAAFTVLLCLFSLIIPKAARSLSRIIALVDFFVFLLVFLLTFVLTAGTEGAPVIDIVTLAVVADTILLYLITAGARKTGKTVLSFICLLFSLAALGGVAYTMYQKSGIYFLGEEMLDKVFVLGALGGALFAAIFAFLALTAKKGKFVGVMAILFNVLTLAAGGACAYFLFSAEGAQLMDYLFVAVTAALSLLLIILNSIRLKSKKEKKEKVVKESKKAKKAKKEKAPKAKKVKESKKEKKAKKAEVLEETAATQPTVSEEVCEAPKAQPAIVSDSSDCKVVETGVTEDFAAIKTEAVEKEAREFVPNTYDWFIESLTDEEKCEFVDLFIYKYIGSEYGLPDYVPGGDNEAFFKTFFAYLNRYRYRISNELMEKMYIYTTKKFK